MLRKFFAFAAMPMVLGGAAFQPARADSNSAPSPQIEAACTNVMGLRPGQEYFAACQDSLTHSLMRKSAAEAMGAAASQCRDKGLAQGSAALSVCMLDQDSSAAPQRVAALQPVSLASVAGTLESGKSYYSVTPSIRWQRERYACAQLGLMPGSGLFGDCVAGLDGALLPDE